jgi:hypothetical protein
MRENDACDLGDSGLLRTTLEAVRLPAVVGEPADGKEIQRWHAGYAAR